MYRQPGRTYPRNGPDKMGRPNSNPHIKATIVNYLMWRTAVHQPRQSSLDQISGGAPTWR